MAELGYMVDGSEPVNWINDISNMYNSTNENGENVTYDRAKYVNETLKNRLAPILDGDGEYNTNLPHYEPYEEKYVVNQNELVDWKVLNLTGTETIPAGQSGYKMEDVGEWILWSCHGSC